MSDTLPQHISRYTQQRVSKNDRPQTSALEVF